MTTNHVLGKVRLEQINEDNVLIFTTENEYAIVPLACDPQKEKETCLISETVRDGIVFRLEDAEREVLCAGLERYRCEKI